VALVNVRVPAEHAATSNIDHLVGVGVAAEMIRHTEQNLNQKLLQENCDATMMAVSSDAGIAHLVEPRAPF
jgi:hypothetical protein